MKTETIYGIQYTLPEVTLLQETGIGTSEVAARTCYDSFENSENKAVQELNFHIDCESSKEVEVPMCISALNDIEHSDLLDDLAWTYFHHSIMEHANLTYFIKGTSRAVLQEHARHRIQAISVRSTRYTMSSVINAFVASYCTGAFDVGFYEFRDLLHKMNLFVTTEINYQNIEIRGIFDKLAYQYKILGQEEFLKITVAKSSLDIVNYPIAKPGKSLTYSVFESLQAGKKKRNVGDAFKHIVTDNWKVDMVVTMNLRALKNYFTLRDSGAAFFQIQWLAQAMKDATPKKYLDLIIKN